jgi:hypothetical protein
VTDDNCTYITPNEIDCLNRTKSAHETKQLRGPSPLEEEPKEPGNQEETRDTLTTKAAVLARQAGLKGTSINKDQSLGKGTPFAQTGDVNSSLQDETPKSSVDRSSTHEEAITLATAEQQSKDTDWKKKLEEQKSRTETYQGTDTTL